MKKFSGLFVLLSAVLICFCKEKPVARTPVKPPVAIDQQQLKQAPPVPVSFTPPADSTITPAQMKSWNGCNPLLDSLTFRYADSFKTKDAAEFIRFQEDFITAQEKICVRAGLSGGYREYKWILQNMGLEKNRAVLQSANAQAF